MKIKIEGMKICSDNERTIPVSRGGKCIQVSSSKYAKCKKELAKLFMAEKANRDLPTYTTNIRVTIHAFTYKDITNIVKILVDSLEDAKIIDDDRNVQEVYLFKIPIKKGKPDKIILNVVGLP